MQKRDIVDILFHTLCTFVLGPSLRLGIPTTWGDRVKEENDGNKRNGTALCWSLNSFGLIALGDQWVGLGDYIICLRHLNT
jgi:hypothetical protein